MRTYLPKAVLLLVAVTGILSLQAASPVPRPSVPLAFSEPSGKAGTIAAYKGKVVVVQFLLTTCPHCQAFSRILTKLTSEYGPKIQAVGLAFDKEDAKGVPNYIKTIGTNFPVGSADTQAVNGFLGISVMDYSRMRVPQVVVIDKKGVIRGQTDLNGNGPVSAEATLRTLLNTLVKE
jgi:cytochrome oxidase Cu insertion factor (SCO1/SenC/PrrC family)